MTNVVNANFLDVDWWERATLDDVKAEITKGADVNAKNYNSITPLMFAAYGNDNPEVIKELVKLGADIDAEDYRHRTPMNFAIIKKNHKAIITLAEIGRNINITIEDKIPLLMWEAMYNEDPLDIRKLVKKGADVNARNYNGMTPLMYAAGDNQNPEIIRTLIELGANINASDDKGCTALMYAAANKTPIPSK